MKYVMIRAKIGRGLHRTIPIIFPNDLTHADVARAIVQMCPEARGGIAVSAGSLNSFDLSGIRPNGKSMTLKLESREEDYGGHMD